MTEREQFCAVLAAATRWTPVDTLVVLAGLDGRPRCQHAATLHRIARLGILAVGKPHSTNEGVWTAKRCAAEIDRCTALLTNTEVIDADNTWQQAVAVAQRCAQEPLQSIGIVASAFHMPRAYLTFIRALQDIGLENDVRMIPFAAPADWWGKPEGCEHTRIELASAEAVKVALYRQHRHVATYTEGLDYLRYWESR